MRFWAGTRIGHRAWLGARVGAGAFGLIMVGVSVLMILGLLHESGLFRLFGHN